MLQASTAGTGVAFYYTELEPLCDIITALGHKLVIKQQALPCAVPNARSQPRLPSLHAPCCISSRVVRRRLGASSTFPKRSPASATSCVPSTRGCCGTTSRCTSGATPARACPQSLRPLRQRRRPVRHAAPAAQHAAHDKCSGATCKSRPSGHTACWLSREHAHDQDSLLLKAWLMVWSAGWWQETKQCHGARDVWLVSVVVGPGVQVT